MNKCVFAAKAMLVALFSLVGIFSSSVAFAAPVGFQGIYQFRGTVQMMGRRTTDVIDTRMADASQRLESLRRAGATCTVVNSTTYRCITLSTQFDPIAAVSLAQRNEGLTVAFGPVTGVPSLVTQGDSFVEWQIPQQTRWNLGAGETYRYLELRGGLVKLVLPGRPELWLNFQDGRLRRFDSITTTVDRWRFFEDYGEVFLER